MNGRQLVSDQKALGWSRQARKSFCAGTPFESPEDVLSAGLKTIGDWVDTIEQFRTAASRDGSTIGKRENNLARDTKPEISRSTIRQQILNVLILHCNASSDGLTAKEIGERIGKTGNNIYQYLVDLCDQGLIKRVKPRNGMPVNSALFRVAGEGEAKR
jgi:hypothetical protein